MDNKQPLARFRDLRVAYSDRIKVFKLVFFTNLGLGPVLRVILYASFHDGSFEPFELAIALCMGVIFDALTLFLAMMPCLFLIAFVRLKSLGWSPVRVTFLSTLIGIICFNAISEYFFFEEFNARFNHIALDYLIYPREVFVNIWDSYNVPLLMGCAVVGALLLSLPIAKFTRGLTFAYIEWKMRFLASLVLMILGVLCCALIAVIPANISTNRIVNEIAQNGFAQLVRAYLTAHLDFGLYYRTLPLAEARSRAASVLGYDKLNPTDFDNPLGKFQLQRTFAAAAKDEQYDVVIILEESFGSEFIGVLGHPERKTSPGFDRWSREGILLANLTATGNRTVRGMEGILCSFPPLPGDSVVKRDHSENVASVARVMKSKGAKTSFFYGGFGLFDSMKPFIMANGFDDFIEQPDYPKGSFRTIWGVADEFVLQAMLEAQIKARKSGQRYLFTALTVSNHKPYHIPRDRIIDLTEKPSRENAVAYADWSLADYLDKAKANGLLEHTIILAVGDHGARVYGREEIPAATYRIPALFLHPDPHWKGMRVERLCSQVDLLPTLLSLAGVSYEGPFFGQDILALPDAGGRAFLQHNRDIGLLTDESLVILGLQKKLYYYQRSGRDTDTFQLVDGKQVNAEMRDLAKDATSVFQTAYELYCHENFRLLK